MKEIVLAVVTRVLATMLLIPAWLRSPGHARRLACGWALSLRFPAEDLAGLTGGTLDAFTAARTEAFWRHRTLLGLTSGHRDAAEQHRLYVDEVAKTEAARKRVLPAKDSAHVRGIALDVRPRRRAVAGGPRRPLRALPDVRQRMVAFRVLARDSARAAAAPRLADGGHPVTVTWGASAARKSAASKIFPAETTPVALVRPSSTRWTASTTNGAVIA